MKRRILSFLAMLTVSIAATAEMVEGLTVEYLDASTTAYKQALSAVSRISFSEGNVTINLSNGTNQEVGAISEIDRISFGQIDDAEQTVTSVTNTERTLSVTAYPNPVADHLHVSGLTEGQQIRIYAADGRMVYAGTDADIDFGGQPRGVYLLVVEKQIVKIVKQ
ncbi:MAG: T9SS type A sorting domain-containing protein [Bacteroidales bacterium]|nr:T9SS type A sorting domain-containing protein [Bacteroidales bacterium]